MAIYRCAECDKFVDDDYYPCEEHPTVDLGLICPDCVETLEMENEDV